MRAKKATCSNTHLLIDLEDESVFAVPLDRYVWLNQAPEEHRSNIEVVHGGETLRWSFLDEELSVSKITGKYPANGQAIFDAKLKRAFEEIRSQAPIHIAIDQAVARVEAYARAAIHSLSQGDESARNRIAYRFSLRWNREHGSLCVMIQHTNRSSVIAQIRPSEDGWPVCVAYGPKSLYVRDKWSLDQAIDDLASYVEFARRIKECL